MYVSIDETKSLIQKECELLNEFITTRNDLFSNYNGKYISRPLNLSITSTDVISNPGMVNITFVYDTNAVNNPTLNSNNFVL